MARDAKTGELVWAYNMTPQDMWDLDEPLITPLVDLNINGQTRKVAIKAARNGLFYVWDRATGKLASEPWMHTYIDFIKGPNYVDMTTGLPAYNIEKISFTNVEDRRRYTQVDPLGGANKPADYTGTEIVYCPGTSARNWENDAFSPKTGLLYTHTDNSCRSLVAFTGEYKPGEGYNLTRQAAGVTVPMKDLQGNNTTVPTELKAFDPVARKIAWVNPNNDSSRTPQMVTTTDLLFKGNNANGNFEAYNARDGKTLWSFRAGSRFNQSPITYLGPDKKQYVAIISSSAAANTAVAANAAPDNANRYRRSGTTLYVFKLPG
jgi:lanthanide-dependent methanol dehydrogenase